jgi:multisubunit Na+/H+ antiporter MnhB subunit
VSEREGFGHYINEARAVGAFVISTDHPPMNELVTPERGALVKPTRVECVFVVVVVVVVVCALVYRRRPSPPSFFVPPSSHTRLICQAW